MFDKQTTQVLKLKKAKNFFMDSVDSDVTWQQDARESFSFRDGNQWTTQEKQILSEEKRPALTFNLTKSHIDLIMGMNEENRVLYRATPTEKNDGFLCEVLNDVVTWLYNQQDFEQEEDSAFESACICGRGFIAVDFVPNPKRFGEITIDVVDVPIHEVHFDPAARKRDLSDASYMFWDKWLSREDFKIRYPKEPDSSIDDFIESGRAMGTWGAVGVPSDIFDTTHSSREDASDYDKPLDLNFYDRAKNMIRVVHMEYWQTFRRYFYIDPETKEFTEFESKDFKNVKAEFQSKYGEDFVYETMMDKRVKWLQFVGDKILYDDFSPMPFDGFSVVPMIAYRDMSKRTQRHFGVVELMKDPQKEINKRWSQTLHLINQSAQPGTYAETDAFVDPEQAEASIKSPGDITWLNSGAIAQSKIKERTMPNFPNATMQMEEHSERIMKQITGINPDLLGQDRGRQEPGIVVRMRQKQGTILLKPLFRNYNTAKKQVFDRLISIIMQYMPDTQIQRILGQNERYVITPEGAIVDKENQLVAEIRNVRDVSYNVSSEESPGNMSKRMLELTAMLEMYERVPVPPEILIEKMDISETEKQRWIKYVLQQQEASIKQQEELKNLEIGKMKEELDIDRDKNKVTREGQLLDTIVALIKTNQMSDQNEIKREANVMSDATEKAKIIAEFISSLASNQAKESNSEGGTNNGKGKQTSNAK